MSDAEQPYSPRSSWADNWMDNFSIAVVRLDTTTTCAMGSWYLLGPGLTQQERDRRIHQCRPARDPRRRTLPLRDCLAQKRRNNLCSARSDCREYMHLRFHGDEELAGRRMLRCRTLDYARAGSRGHAVSAIGGLGGSFRTRAGLRALGLLDGTSHAP